LLNQEQLNAVNHDFGPALIMAGPGSGKTTVITHHINHLIRDLNVPPDKILVISFSRASAKEMKVRFSNVFPNSSYDVNFGTFHSVFYKFLKLYNSIIPSIIDEQTKSKIIYKLINDSESTDKVSSAISFYKSQIDKSIINITDPKIIKIIDDYNKILSENNIMDYDDILVKCYLMLCSNQSICNDLKSRFDAILIDEFQDINEYQYECIRFISNGNLFVVGDEDQSIYSFRGANAEIMKKFIIDYPETVIYNLTVNYRCQKEIISASNKVISVNPGRLSEKVMYAYKESSGKHFDIIIAKTISEELQNIYRLIKSIPKDKTIAILTRTNKDAEHYADKIKAFEEDISSAVKQKILFVIHNYLNYCLYNNQESLLSIINIPNRYIPRNILIHESLNDLSSSKRILISGEINSFNNHINILKGCTPQTFLLYLKNIIRIDTYIEEILPDAGEIKINEEFQNIITNIKQLNTLKDLYEYTLKYRDSGKSNSTDNIKVMTFHASKGLEFDVVIIPDVVEGIIPGRISIGNMNIEEERRLFYVAMTRAKEYLAIITMQNEDSSKYMPSRFLEKLM